MRRTALKRRTPLRSHGKPLRRRRKLRAKREAPRRVGADVVRDPAFRAWVARQPCAVGLWLREQGLLHLWPCDVGADLRDAHHAGKMDALSRKPSERLMFAGCRRHHRDVEDRKGPCEHMTPDEYDAWQAALATWTRERYEHERAGEVHVCPTLDD